MSRESKLNAIETTNLKTLMRYRTTKYGKYLIDNKIKDLPNKKKLPCSLRAGGVVAAVLPDPRKPSRPILPKTTAGLGPFTASKIFLHCRFHGRFYLQLFYEKKHIKSLNTH
jgi:hypothetical protein